MSDRCPLKYHLIYGILIVICLVLLCRECNSGLNIISKTKKTDTVYVRKPTMVDVVSDSSLVSRLRKMFKKTDTFVITKYIPVKVTVKDTKLVPYNVIDTVLFYSKDSSVFKLSHYYKKQNVDSSLFYGFLINTKLTVLKDTIHNFYQEMKDMYLGLRINIYEVKRVKRFGFTEKLISITSPKDVKIEATPYYVREKTKRFGVGFVAGIGVTPYDTKPVPFVGIGLSFNPFLIR